MDYKSKHSNKLKKAFLKGALVVGGAVVTAGFVSCKDRFINHKPEYNDMLSRDTIHGVDLYGNKVVLKKVSFKLYADETGKPSDIMQTCWGIEKGKNWPDRSGESTHIEKVMIGDPSLFTDNYKFVRVYDKDNVLVDQNCFLVDARGTLCVIGDEDHYVENLDRYHREREDDKVAVRKKKRDDHGNNRNTESISLNDVLVNDSVSLSDSLKNERVDTLVNEHVSDSVKGAAMDSLFSRGNELDL